MSFFISQAHAQSAGAAGGPPGGELFQIGFLVLMFGLFYFIAIRPQRKRQKSTPRWWRRCLKAMKW